VIAFVTSRAARTRAAAVTSLTALVLFLGGERSAGGEEKEPILTLPVAVSAVFVDGGRVVDDAWVEAQWSAVDRLYAKVGIRFERRWVEPLPETSARLDTKEDRDALGPHVTAGAISVFFVKALMDIDEIGRIRMGVCWRAPGDRRIVAVASNAKPTVLAHELGHFLGNGHSKVVDNVMSYERTGGPVFFDARQKATMRATAAQLLRDGVVKIDVGKAEPIGNAEKP
jgi:hypothetical protein